MAQTRSMDFRVLGPLEVVADGVSIELGPFKQRALLALLIVNANHVVSTDRILDALWGEEGANKEKALWVYVSRLRSALEPDREGHGESTLLIRREPGYILAIDPQQTDLVRFQDEVAACRSLEKDDPTSAVNRLEAVLGMWRGEALEEFTYEEFAAPVIDRLEELRFEAVETRIDALLGLGQSGELVAELETLVREHPHRERPVGQLMVALYRSGRQSEALRAFERHKRIIAEELGIDPSPELQRLEEQILLHDPTLATRQQPAPSIAGHVLRNPYKGLRVFHEDDAADFYGRSELIDSVLARLGKRNGLVALVGPSGSGKSSVVRAGVLPALRKGVVEGSDGWQIATMVPGAHPFTELEVALLRSTIDPPDSITTQLTSGPEGILHGTLRVMGRENSHLLLVIDQFEELFTLVDDPDVRRRFLDALLTAIDDPQHRITVLLTLRADFYDKPLQHPGFGARLGSAQVNVTPLSAEELEEAATQPAMEVNVAIEASLLGQLIVDVVDQPGALPMFQYTLTELFDRREDSVLLISDYQAMGGVRGAITNRADELYQALATEEQEAARQLFLRLVALSGDDSLSRRRVPASEITSLDVDVVALQTVIERFGQARLLSFDRERTTGTPTVEVGHEALLTEWDRLAAWIGDARQDLVRHASLAAAVDEWDESGRDTDYLVRGTRLAEYERFAATGVIDLNARELEYLGAAIERRERELEAERERTAAETTLAGRAKRRLWGLVAVIVAMAAGLATWAIIVAVSDTPTIALVNVFPRDSDNEFENLIYLGFDQAARTHGFEAIELPLPYTDPAATLAALVESGIDLIISPEGLTQIPTEFLAKYSDIPFILLEGTATDFDNAYPYVMAANEGAFLAGAAAAMASQTGTVGFVGAVQLADIIDPFRAGYIAGAQYIDPDIEVISTHASTQVGLDAFVNAPAGHQAATMLFDRGADVVFHAASQTGDGVFDATRERSESTGRQHWAIGVDSDQYYDAPAADRPYILTSVTKHIDQVIAIAIDDFLTGRLQPGMRTITLADGGVGYGAGAGDQTLITSRLDAIREGIADATIPVPYVPIDRPLPPPGFVSSGTATVVFNATGECVFDYAGEPIQPGAELEVEIINDSDRVVHFSGLYPLRGGAQHGSTYVTANSSNVFYSGMDEEAGILALACNPDPGGPDDAFNIVHEFVATG